MKTEDLLKVQKYHIIQITDEFLDELDALQKSIEDQADETCDRRLIWLAMAYSAAYRDVQRAMDSLMDWIDIVLRDVREDDAENEGSA